MRYERLDCPYIGDVGTWELFKKLFPDIRILTEKPPPEYYVVADIVEGDKLLLGFADAWRISCFVKGALYAVDKLRSGCGKRSQKKTA